ncbi:hypothetical protein AB5L52_09785 [Streptomyces sp. CG4]|uniref:hypothetical protein n=1 Tax=Streptomyces sp. CG4 TaxID=408783 RepID=UPI0034E24C47
MTSQTRTWWRISRSSAGERCTYGRAWTDITYGYGLSIMEREKEALASMINTCD